MTYLVPPQPGDKFFVPGDDYNRTYASINRAKGLNNEMTSSYIIDGYRECSLFLLDGILASEDWAKIDSWIYPILFNFRHYLEAIMKDILRYHRIINREIGNDKVGFKSEHSLRKLWLELKPYLMSTYDSTDETEMMAVEDLIKELEESDGGSFTFRYPFKTAKDKNAPIVFNTSAKTIDLDNLKQSFEKCMYFFDSIHLHAAAILDEIQSNWSGY